MTPVETPGNTTAMSPQTEGSTSNESAISTATVGTQTTSKATVKGKNFALIISHNYLWVKISLQYYMIKNFKFAS